MKHLLSTLILFCSISVSAVGKQYTTALVERIASFLPQTVVTSKDSIVIERTYPCAIRKRVEGDAISMLGFYIFNNRTASSIRVMADFLECYMLELYIQGKDHNIKSKLNSQGVSWKENGRTPASVKESMIHFLQQKNKSDNFSYSFADGLYTAEWKFASTSYAISFPAERQLIYGTDLAESELIISNALKRGNFKPCTEAKIMPLASLHQFSDLIYRDDGLVYSKQEKYTSDTFYEKISDNEARAYFNKKHPDISLLSIITGIAPSENRKLNVSLHLYGGKIEHYLLPPTFINASLFSDTQKYYHIDITSDDLYYARIIFYNEMFQFVHVMEISVPTSSIFNPNAEWKAHLYCNIPQHNLKNYIKK